MYQDNGYVYFEVVENPFYISMNRYGDDNRLNIVISPIITDGPMISMRLWLTSPTDSHIRKIGIHASKYL